jgi:type I restriction enzyme S subunit
MTGDMRPHPEYKDSLLPWLGRVPAHWEEKRAKYYFAEVDERSPTGAEELMSVSHVTGVTPRKQNVTMFRAESNIGHKICWPGDLVVNTMWAWMAALGVARQTGVVSPSYGVYRPRNGSAYLPDYVDYLLRTRPYASEYLCRSTGIRASRLRLYPDDFLDIPIVHPPREEQDAMVRFLAHQGRLADRFIRNRRRLIDVLQEQKQATINEAVTRGLDANVPMKDSGIDWLGEIPEHWQVCRLKTVGEVIMGQSPPSSECNAEGVGLPFLQGSAEFGPVHPRAAQYCPTAPKTAPAEAILLSVRAPVGALNVADQNYAIGRGLCAVVPDERRVTRAFAVHGISASKTQLLKAATGSTYDAVSVGDVGSVRLPLPPRPEQVQIAQHITSTTGTLSRAISGARQAIDLICEYRTRLVADVVTGKVDVRHLAPVRSEELADSEPGEPGEAPNGEISEEDEGGLAQEAADADD